MQVLAICIAVILMIAAMINKFLGNEGNEAYCLVWAIAMLLLANININY